MSTTAEKEIRNGILRDYGQNYKRMRELILKLFAGQFETPGDRAKTILEIAADPWLGNNEVMANHLATELVGQSEATMIVCEVAVHDPRARYELAKALLRKGILKSFPDTRGQKGQTIFAGMEAARSQSTDEATPVG